MAQPYYSYACVIGSEHEQLGTSLINAYVRMGEQMDERAGGMFANHVMFLVVNDIIVNSEVFMIIS